MTPLDLSTISQRKTDKGGEFDVGLHIIQSQDFLLNLQEWSYHFLYAHRPCLTNIDPTILRCSKSHREKSYCNPEGHLDCLSQKGQFPSMVTCWYSWWLISTTLLLDQRSIQQRQAEVDQGWCRQECPGRIFGVVRIRLHCSRHEARILYRSIKKDNNGKMLKIVFCNEGPEVGILILILARC